MSSDEPGVYDAGVDRLAPLGASVPDDEVPDDEVLFAGEAIMAELLQSMAALRQDVKLQVRSNRALQQLVQDNLQRIEQRIAARVSSSVVESTGSSDDARMLADAIAEVEESLQRAIDNLASRPAAPRQPEANPMVLRFDELVAASPWWTRRIAGGLLNQIRGTIGVDPPVPTVVNDSIQAIDAAHRGLQLLLTRVHRLMQQCDVVRENVARQPFDAETMLATDFIDAPSIPSSHVAEQLRPLYRWRGRVLRCANVRLAR